MRCVDTAKPPSDSAKRARLHLRLIFAIIGHDPESDGRSPMATLTKRQKQLIDYLNDYISEHGYAPTLAEVGQYFGLSSLATVHKHLHNLEQKGFIKRQHNHSRALEVSGAEKRDGRGIVKLLGQVAAGAPIEAIESNETISVPD